MDARHCGRTASWWSRIGDLAWPDPRVRDRVRRRADAYAEAKVETVIHFGFHCRFDFAPYLGLIHGLLADIAEALHARGIAFLDHYSCNVVARPRSREEMELYASGQRHHVAIHPDAFSAPSAGYDGFRFDDLREVDVGTGGPAYSPSYQAELFCHNNPDFLEMHRRYLLRQLADAPLNGVMADDMCDYAWFRGCGCVHCRRRFRDEFGRELPPLADASFWGDTSRHPSLWGNYGNPAFRDWVRLRYRSTADHLALVKKTIGPDRILMTCCSSSGPMVLNSMGLSYESFIGACDWVMLENCGLAADTVRWDEREPEAVLHKSIAALKAAPRPDRGAGGAPADAASRGGAPALAASYFAFADGAYLGWAIARFWGVDNWATTLLQGPFPDGTVEHDEPELVGDLNRWEERVGLAEPRVDLLDAALAFLRSSRDNGWKDEAGRDHWTRTRAWAEAFTRRSLGYRFVLAGEIANGQPPEGLRVPLVLDGCAHLCDAECAAVEAFLGTGGTAVVAPPLGTHDDRGFPRERSLLDRLRATVAAAAAASDRLIIVERGTAAERLERLVAAGTVVPRITTISGPAAWAARLRIHGGRPVLHLMNRDLAGVEHPTLEGRPPKTRVLHRIEAGLAREPLVLDVELAGTGCDAWSAAELLTPEQPSPRVVRVEPRGASAARLAIDLTGLRLYAMVRDRR